MPASDGEHNSLYLYQLVGAPIMSMVQAEAQATRASMDFIRRLGFEDIDGDEQSDASEIGNFGKLREVTFQYDKADDSGQTERVQLRIPLLSLIPIPMLQIKSADIEMFVKVVDVEFQSSGENRMTPKVDGPKNADDHFLEGNLLQLRTAIGTDPNSTVETRPASEFQMKLNVKMEQSHFPDGIQKLLNLMSSNIVQSPVRNLSENNEGG